MKFKNCPKAILTAVGVAMLLGACTGLHPVAENTVDVNLVAINDFHGNLESSTFKYTSARDNIEHTVKAGGASALAADLQAWRKEDGELLLVGAGDLVGASPPMSSMWADEPTITAMNLLGLRASSVGNHEFDQGRVELLRQQNGGCVSSRADKACKIAPDFAGAQFTYLAANVLDKASGKPFLPAYRIEVAHGVKIAFIGAVLKDTASVVLASGIEGLEFVDEASSINNVLPELRAQGVNAFVVLIHQGGHSSDRFDEPDCTHLEGPIVDVVRHLDPAIRLIISGHSHTGYACKVDGRTVTQADMGGHLVSRIRLRIDRASDTVRAVDARNLIVQSGEYPPDVNMDNYLKTVKERSATILASPVARLAVAGVTRDTDSAGESAMGDLVADSMLAATRQMGAQIAFANKGGMRQDLVANEAGIVTLGQVQSVLPFGNRLVVMNLTGAQIRELLEHQWQADRDDVGLLQVSDGFSYRWQSGAHVGAHIVPGSLTLNGVALDDARRYRVTANNFLVGGGDGFSMFSQGTDRFDSGIADYDCLIAYLHMRDHDGKPAGMATAARRITRVP